MAERVSRRLAAQLHEPDGDELLGGLRGDAAAARRRPVPLGAEHHAGAGRARRRAVRGGHVPRRRRQPPGLDPALRARRRDLYPLLDEAIARRSRAAPARPRRAVPPVRLLPDRVERALRRVRALAHAPRRRARAAADPGRRVRAPLRGEPARVRRHARAGSRAASRSRGAEPRVRGADRAGDRDGRAARHLRQRAQRRPDRQPARGACVEVPCLVDAPASSRRTSARCRRSAPRSTAAS